LSLSLLETHNNKPRRFLIFFLALTGRIC